MAKILKKFVSGQINATIFENISEQLKVSVVTEIVRVYKDESGKWQHSTRYFETDLDDVAVVSTKAKEFLRLKVYSEEDFKKTK